MTINHNPITLFSIFIIFQIFLISGSDEILFKAYAEADLSAIDMQIQNVEIEPVTNLDTQQVIKLSVFFQNNGESRFMLVNEQIMLIFAKPNTLPNDLAPDFGEVTIKGYDITNHLKLEYKYPDFKSGTDCKRTKLNVPPQEARKKIFCFEVSESIHNIKNSIINEQYFLKIEAVPVGSSCPNCTVISLNNVISLDDSIDDDSLKSFGTDEYVKKEIIVNQKCSDGILKIQITNQDKIQRAGAYLTSSTGGDVYAKANEDGIAIIPDNKQGRLMKVVSGTYVPILIRAENCMQVNNGLVNEFIESQTKLNNHIIPKWVHNNAKWWVDGQIDDGTFVSGIQHLIQEDMILVSSTSNSNITTNKIPEWIKNNADWWSQGLISDIEFLKGIEFSVENGIIKVS